MFTELKHLAELEKCIFVRVFFSIAFPIHQFSFLMASVGGLLMGGSRDCVTDIQQ